MNKPTEYQIELFVKNPVKLSREERRWVREWVESDEEVRLLAVWFKEFYNLTEEIKQNSERKERKPSIIHLKAVSNQFNTANNFVLAAQTTVAKNKHKSIKTFISEKYKTLIRVIYDDVKLRSRLHVISQYLNEKDIVILKLEDNLNFFISKPGGILEISESVIPKEKITDLEKCSMHLPILKIDLFRDSITGNITYTSDSADKVGFSHIMEISKDEIKIDVENISNTCKPDKIVLHTGGNSSLWLINSGFCRLPVEKLKSSNSLLFFYK
ncbi:MAG: hypothetical protein JJU13_13720 [Balneolaceae bacterium]|nr:hypothetical protein [Balneolaceae bacterium]